MNDYDYLIQQLNLLIGFLDVSDENVYNQIKTHDRYSLGITIEELYQNSYENYSSHISSSAFILGFTHFEDFLTKRIVKYLIHNPTLNTYKVPIKTIHEKGESLVTYLAVEQARRLTFSEKIKLIEANISAINSKLAAELRFANDIRNCLMHHNGIADNRIQQKFNPGDKIILKSGDVNGLGLTTRMFAKQIWDSTMCYEANTPINN